MALERSRAGNRSWLRLAIAGVLSVSSARALAQPAPPLVTTPEWFVWYQSLLDARLAACPLARGTTYYFSQSGNDTTGNGSIGNPWKSLAKAQAVLNAAAPGGDVALLFKRGDVWRQSVGIDTATPHITIADYGKGAKPLFTAFESVGTPTAWVPVPGIPNVYSRAETSHVSWVKEDDNLDEPYSQHGSQWVVATVPGSWYWEADGELFIHPKHTAAGVASDPRSDGKAYELVRPSTSGVLVRGNGTRVQNIRAQGWGITQALGTQKHGIDCRVSGTDQAVFVGCESHYGLAHVMTHFVEGYGGIATFVDCKAGLTVPLAGGGSTMFNTYATQGGNQTIFHQCTATHGTLPDVVWNAARRGGQSFYGHTDTTPNSLMGLTIAYGCTTRDTTYGCRAPANFDNLTEAATLSDVRCFIVNEVFEGGPSTGEGFYVGVRNGARVNGRYQRMRPRAVPSASLAGGSVGGWVINCTLEIDCSDQPINFALFNGNPAQNSQVQIWNSYLRVTTPPDIRFSLDWDFPNQSVGSSFVNSILANSGGGTCLTNLGAPGSQVGNAYFGVLPEGYTNDPAAVVLPSAPAMGVEPGCLSLLSCSGTPLPGGMALSYDQRQQVRYRNAIGPIQTPPCANCDGTSLPPVLNSNDFNCFLNKYASGDPLANCDGSTFPPVLNANDFQCFVNLFAAGCR